MTDFQSQPTVTPGSRHPIRIMRFAAWAVVGAVLTYVIFVPYLIEHGLNLADLAQHAVGNPIAGLLTLDIVLSSLVFWDFMRVESKRLGLRGWRLLIIPNLLVGLSCALPLFLLWREVKLNAARAEGRA